MSVPTPGDVVRAGSARGVVPSEGPCGDAPLDEVLTALSQSGASFEAGEVDASCVVEAAQALHDRIHQRLEEAQ